MSSHTQTERKAQRASKNGTPKRLRRFGVPFLLALCANNQLKSIRMRLTCWYILTTFLILLLYSGLLYSTLLKMLPLSLTSPQAQQIGFQFILIGLAILLVVAISGYWLAAHAMRPVRLMTQTAERIGQANLNERLQIKGSLPPTPATSCALRSARSRWPRIACFRNGRRPAIPDRRWPRLERIGRRWRSSKPKPCT